MILCYNIFGDYVKKCAVIYNPNSGKGLMLGHLDEFRDILLDNNYETDFFNMYEPVFNSRMQQRQRPKLQQ